MSFIRDVLIGILANFIWHHRQRLMFRAGCALGLVAGWISIASDWLIDKGGCLLLSGETGGPSLLIPARLILSQ